MLPKAFLSASDSPSPTKNILPIPSLNDRARKIIHVLTMEEALGVSEISNLLSLPLSSVHKSLVELEQSGIIEKTARQKRMLTSYGREVASLLN